jgi:hypothetical protein
MLAQSRTRIGFHALARQIAQPAARAYRIKREGEGLIDERGRQREIGRERSVARERDRFDMPKHER